MAECGIAGNGGKPGTHFGGIVKAADFFPCRKKSLLRNILTRRDILHQRQRHPAHHSLMPFHEHNKGSLITGGGLASEFGVGFSSIRHQVVSY